MDRFNFLSRNRGVTDTQVASQNRTDDRNDEYGDEAPLSPQVIPDLEAQRGVPEMIERPAPHASFLPRFRPAIPSWFSVASSRRAQQHPARPPSSHYSGDGGPPDTVVNGGEIESPKTPLFRIGAQDLPSTRLHLPNLTRTWTQGSNGPPTRPATARASPAPDGITMPAPAVTAAVREVSAEAETGRQRRRHRRGGSEGSHRSRHRSNRSRDETQSRGRSDGSSRSRRTRRRDRERQREQGQLDEQEQQSRERRRRHRRRERERERTRQPPPKHFLFCFPWVKSRRMRTQIMRVFVSGILLAMLLTICECLIPFYYKTL